MTTKEGVITFISMKDFMTFRNVSFLPGTGFNVVVGHNGAGKSSIVSAITIALGGDVATLRRQGKLADFVNTVANTDHAEVKIKLCRSDNRSYEILCNIFKNNAISFFLDGRQATKQQVAKLAEQLQIQTNNMCQFLPQDVVREFPEMTPGKIFHSTIRAVGDQETLMMHEDLKNHQETSSALSTAITTRKDTHQALLQKSVAAKKLLARITAQQKVADSIKLHELKVKYLEVQKFKDDLKKKKKELNVVEKNHADAEAKVTTLKAGLKGYEEAQREPKKLLQQNKSVVEATAKAMLNPKVEEIGGNIDRLVRNIKSFDDKLNNREKRIEQVEETIKTTAEKLEAIDKAEIIGALRELTEQIGNVKARIEEATDVMEQHKKDAASLESRKNGLLRQRAMITTDDMLKLNLLKKRNMDAYQGVNWLRSNFTEFTGEVHEPIMMVLQLKDARNACYLQKLVGPQDLEAFVCDRPSDMNKLMISLRNDQKLRKINVVQSSTDASTNQQKSPSVPSHLQSYLVAFVDDMFTCPPSIRTFLRKKKGLHKIPVFSGDVNADMVKDHFPIFFINRKKFVVRMGRYSKTKSTIVDDCEHDRCHHFLGTGGVGGDDEVAALDEQLRELEKTLVKKKKDLALSEPVVKKYKLELDKFDKELAVKRLQKGEMEKLENLLGVERHTLEILRQTQAEDSEDVKKKTESQLQEELQKYADTLKEVNKIARESVAAAVLVQLYTLIVLQLEDSNSDKKLELEKALETSNTLHAAKTKLRNDCSELQKKFKDQYSTLEWANKNTMDIPPALANDFHLHCPETREEILARLQTLREELQSFPNVTDAQKKEAVEIDQKLKDSELDIEKKQKEYESMMEDARKKERLIVKRIEKLVQRIDSRFSEMMTKMGNSGSVQLEGTGDCDFKNYGLSIMVKFANSKAPMHKLAANVQSGGEKSVATALYMMALQQLTRVPFRCVDEINQGMDEANERKVWHLLLTTSSEHSAQYFYMAPKFPRQLPFDGNTTLLLCNNGSVKKRKSTFNMESYIRRAKRRKQSS